MVLLNARIENRYIPIVTTIPIVSLGIVHKAYLEKEQKFRLVMMVEIVSNVLALALAIILAKANFGVYSLVAQSLLQTILSTILFFKLSSIKVSLSNCDIKKRISVVYWILVVICFCLIFKLFLKKFRCDAYR